MKNYIITIGIIIISKVIKILFDFGTKFALGNVEYGKFTILFSKETLLATIMALGINNFIIKKMPELKNRTKNAEKKYIYNSFYIIFIVFISIFIFNMIFLNRDSKSNKVIMLLIIICAFFDAIIRIFGALLRANKKVIESIWISETKVYFLFVILIYIFSLINNINVYKATIILLISFIITAVIANHKLRKNDIENLRISKENIDINICREIIKYSIPVLLSGFSYILLQRMDILMLDYYHIDYASIGNYNIIIKLTSQMIFFVQLAITIYIPSLSREFANNTDYKLIKRKNEKKVTITFLATALIILTFFIINYYFNILSIFSINTKSEFDILVLFSISKLIYSILFVYGYILYFNNYIKFQYINNITILITGILFNIVGIKYFGVKGAAIATIIGVLLGNFLEMIQVLIFIRKSFISRKRFMELIIGILITSILIININNFGILPLIILWIVFSSIFIKIILLDPK